MIKKFPRGCTGRGGARQEIDGTGGVTLKEIRYGGGRSGVENKFHGTGRGYFKKIHHGDRRGRGGGRYGAGPAGQEKIVPRTSLLCSRTLNGTVSVTFIQSNIAIIQLLLHQTQLSNPFVLEN